MVNAQNAAIRQQEELTQEKKRLAAELATKRKDADAYDREFLDRLRGGEGSIKKTTALGISTLQDWILLLFYSMYATATIALAVFIGIRAQQNKLVGIAGVLLGSTFIAVMFSMVIVRFA